MNSGATIFDDRETVEFLRDRPHLLAIADAVRATQRERTRSALRRKPLLIAAAAALVACATAAALIAVFAVPGTSPQHTAAGGGPPNHPVTVSGDAPGGPVPLSQVLSSAAKSFGVPIILPNTPVLKPSDAAPTASEEWLPSPAPGVQEPVSQVVVEFPSPYVSISYSPTALTDQGKTYPNALDQYQAEMAQSAHPGDDQIVRLSDGTPALITHGPSGNSIEFRLGKLSITIWAPDNNGVPTTVDAPTLQTLAQSMVDQAGSQ